MKKATPLIIVFAFVISAFYFSWDNKKPEPNRYLNLRDTLIVPFDTLKVLTMMKITNSVNEVSKYLNEKPFSEYAKNTEALHPKIDTLDLIDMRWACDCPNWRYADSTSQKFPANKDFYIEPADDKLILPECLRLGRIQFIGREYYGIGYPKNPQFEDPHPPMGRVFKYYSYKIYKPFTVWGPQVKSDIDNYYSATELKVK